MCIRDRADLDALTVRVGDIEKAGYQTAEQVQAAIAASGHAHFEVAETDPTAEGFEAQANVMYLYMNKMCIRDSCWTWR